MSTRQHLPSDKAREMPKAAGMITSERGLYFGERRKAKLPLRRETTYFCTCSRWFCEEKLKAKPCSPWSWWLTVAATRKQVVLPGKVNSRTTRVPTFNDSAMWAASPSSLMSRHLASSNLD